MAKGPEALLVDRIRRAILKKHPSAYIVKIAGGGYQSAGLPDLLVQVAGRSIWIEVKAQRSGESRDHALGRVTLRQQVEIDKLRAAGVTAGVALSVEDSLRLVGSAIWSE